MKNLNFSMSLVDGGLSPMDFQNGRDLIHQLWGDDFAAPPVILLIEAVADSGEVVKIRVSYDDRDQACVEVSR
jgi:hypothetical protein